MTHQKASREIKKYLLSIVRNDWDWPPDQEPAADGTGPNIVAHAFERYTATEFRERYYGTTDESAASSEDDSASSGDEDDKANEDEAYKFDSPDAVGGLLEAQARRKRRRRKLRLEEEMGYNEGMRCFVERRNAWTAAKSQSEGAQRIDSKHQLDTDRAIDTTASAETGGSEQVPRDTDESSNTDSPVKGPTTVVQATDSHSTDGDKPTTRTTFPDLDPLIPIAPPLINADNPLRAAITPKTYSDIFSKIVVSSRTPTTPINLADMTAALVQGWKEHGEWPPKMSSVEPVLAARRKGRGRGSVPASADGAATGRHRAEHSLGLGEGLLAHHPHFKRGVEGVKRVFRLSSGGNDLPKQAGPDVA